MPRGRQELRGRFNGAARFHARIVQQIRNRLAFIIELQRGRALSRADCLILRPISIRMLRFNGAARFHARIVPARSC